MDEGMLRIGDAERERAAAELGEHYAAGRLDAEEHSERLEQVWRARTQADLRPVFRDLPGRYGPAAAARPAPRHGPSYRPGPVPFARRLPAPVVAVLAVLLVVTVLTHLPVIVLGLLVWCFVATRRHGTWTHGWPARHR